MVKDTSKLATAIVFAYIADFVFNMLYHGNFMMSEYMATAKMWRDKQSMHDLYAFGIVGHLIVVSILGIVFAKGFEGKGYGEGCRFGVLVGLLFAAGNISMFSYIPIPPSILTKWVLGSLLEGQVIGLSFALIYGLKPEPKAKSAKKSSKKK